MTVPSSSRHRPGRDEITLTVVEGRRLCYSRDHRTQGRLAEVIVVFGELGTDFQDALWRELWGRSLAMCGDCLNLTRTVVIARRPNLVIHDRRPRSLGHASGVRAG
jgi:hypothetical protein